MQQRQKSWHLRAQNHHPGIRDGRCHCSRNRLLNFCRNRSPERLGVVLKRHKLQPHRSKYWCRAPGLDDDPEKRRKWGEALDNVLEVYARPYDPKHPYICLDEKTLQLLAEVHDPLEMAPGQILKVDSEYERKGTAAMFVITEPQTGRCAVSVRAHRTAADFAEVVAYVSDTLYPDAEDVTIVPGNLNTHPWGVSTSAIPKGKQTG